MLSCDHKWFLIPMDIYQRLSEKLEIREKQHNLRTLPNTFHGIDFLSNDYLGLARSAELKNNIQEAYSRLPSSLNGATGSRLLSGNSLLAEDLETYLAEIFDAPAALLFNSGYTANLALLATIPQRGDTIILDELAHACMHEGARLSFADKFSFHHNDIADLEKKIKRVKGACFVVVESIYSMDGDEAPLRAIQDLCKLYKAHLMVDEAHSTGVTGGNGSGLVCHFGLEKEIFARVYTFGKAMGVHGAVVVGEEMIKKYLINFARAFIYTTALPAHSLVSVKESFLFLKANIHLQKHLKEVIEYFNNYAVPKFHEIGIEILPGNSAIKALIIPGSARIRKLAERLQFNGFIVKPILAPTVKEGSERLRICLHAYNTKEEINALTEAVIAYMNE